MPPPRFVAVELKATRRPSPLIDARYEKPSPCAPAAPLALEASVVVAASTLRTKTSEVPFVSGERKLPASDSNAIERPSELMSGLREALLPPGPSPSARDTRRVVPAATSRTYMSSPGAAAAG